VKLADRLVVCITSDGLHVPYGWRGKSAFRYADAVGAAGGPARRAGRAGVDDTALQLFAEHGVAGTSLQMIADAMGVAKSAVYHHYKTKDEIVLGVLAPLLDELPRVVDRARAHRSRAAQVDAMLIGLVDLAVGYRARYAVITRDPYVVALLGRQARLREWWEDAVELLVGPQPDLEHLVAVTMLIGALPAPVSDDMLPDSDPADPAELRAAMLASARRLLQLPRRATRTADPSELVGGIGTRR
jgi:AcrR family transcriptional regulator